MKWGIIVDSGSDLLESFLGLDGIGFESAPLKIITDNKEFIDDASIDIDELLTAMKKSAKSSSACPNTAEFHEAMVKYDNCICVTITGALSGSYNAACVARDMIHEEHPEKNIKVIDCRAAAGVMELTVKYAASLIKKGLSFDEIAEMTESYCRERKISIALSTYDNLIKNGKMSHIAGLVASTLGIRAVSTFNENGELVAKHKVRGEDKALCAMTGMALTEGGLDGKDIVITHCKNEAGAEKLIAKLKEQWKIKSITVRESRGLVTYYAMPGGVVLSY
ncbi:MAG: DegV family protein [Clostridia bacterium]|nr:DegV family protein [Clostridia bacterium]